MNLGRHTVHYHSENTANDNTLSDSFVYYISIHEKSLTESLSDC